MPTATLNLFRSKAPGGSAEKGRGRLRFNGMASRPRHRWLVTISIQKLHMEIASGFVVSCANILPSTCMQVLLHLRERLMLR